MIALFQSRMQNSDMKSKQSFSTPSFKNRGVDRGYQLSDQREYVVKCTACNHHQIPLFTPAFVHVPNFNIDVSDFADLTPTQIAGLDVEKAYVRREQCYATLDPGNPTLHEWGARHPKTGSASGRETG